MKIKDMTREELKAYMLASREIHSFDDQSPSWKRAFELAHQAGNSHWTMDCNKCVSKVREWILA